MTPCELHRVHTPKPLSSELHHIIPVAWQLLWKPATAPFPGRDIDGRGMLWDACQGTGVPMDATPAQIVDFEFADLGRPARPEEKQTILDALEQGVDGCPEVLAGRAVITHVEQLPTA